MEVEEAFHIPLVSMHRQLSVVRRTTVAQDTQQLALSGAYRVQYLQDLLSRILSMGLWHTGNVRKC